MEGFFDDDAVMSHWDLAAFAVGWTMGWLLLWRSRPLPVPRSSEVTRRPGRDAIAVVVPARDEAQALQLLAPAIRAQLGAGDEFVIVDDHSTDETSAVARTFGATELPAPELRT